MEYVEYPPRSQRIEARQMNVQAVFNFAFLRVLCGSINKKPPPRRRPQSKNLRPYCCLASALLAASDFAYFRRKRSTRPAVSTSFCLPVKNGWQFEQISRLMAPLCVDRVVNVFPHAQCTRTSSYLGWIAAFIASDTFRGKSLILPEISCFWLDMPTCFDETAAAKDSRPTLYRCPSAQNRSDLLVLGNRGRNKDKPRLSAGNLSAIHYAKATFAFRNRPDPFLMM